MKKKNTKYIANYKATADDIKPNITMDDVLNEVYAQEDAKNKTPAWVGITESIADTAINLFDGIVKPLLGISSTSTGGVTIETEQKDSTMKYLIIGAVIIVAIVLIMKFAKK